jgi:hypothetical protein
MYEESRGRFTLRDVILQLLIVVLFVFLLVWLFPTKGYIDSKVDPLLDTIFNTNIITMKDAAKDYFTLSRLPQNVGDKVKMTLREMETKKLLVDFTDKYGNQCDLDASYVEVTKYDDEYVMKVYLKCSKQEDYILVHMGCYDYCSTTLCEKKDTKIVDSCGKTVTPVVTPDEPTPTPTPEKKYICEYAYSTSGYYTPWVIGDWTTNHNTEISGTYEINDTKTETITKDVKVLTGYEYKQYYDGTQPIYSYYNVVVGKTGTTTKTCTTTTTYTETVTYSYGSTKYMGQIQTNTPKTSGSGDTYDLVSANPIICDVNCGSSASMIYTYNMYAASSNKTYDTISSDGGVTQCTETTTYEPITETVQVLSDFGKAWLETPVYRTDTYAKTVTYYQYKSRSWVGGTSDTKWSNCNDTGLLNSGYVLTGNRKEVTE